MLEDSFKLTSKSQNLLSRYGLLVLGGSCIQNFAEKEFMRKAFKDMLHELGEVNPTHAYYNGSRTSQVKEDPSWSTQVSRTRRQRLSSISIGSAWMSFYFVVFVLVRNIDHPLKNIEDRDDSWVEAMQEELLQFRLQQVWILVDLPHEEKEEGIKYDEVFAPVARIEAISGEMYVLNSGYVDPGYLRRPRSALTKQLRTADEVDVHLYDLLIGYSQDFTLNRYSDYAGANLDRKSTTGGCQFLGSRLISWQCKKQTIVATSTTEAEYVAAASCCGQVLWIQNQMLDYGFNFMNTKIHIDNESTICIVKNPVYHSKTKHIEIRHHFIRDSYEKKLIRVEKIHTDFNVADLLTKALDGLRFNFLVVNIGMINP
ncbi:hypothetical protein Tco_0159073 [Tanacetum coccineum]